MYDDHQAHVHEYDELQGALLDAEIRDQIDQARAQARELLSEWYRLMTLDNTPLEFVGDATEDQPYWPDYSAELAAVEQKLTAHMSENRIALADQPIWEEWFDPDEGRRPPRIAPVSAPSLHDDPPF
ncbi:hypothetical protein ATM97_02865 [Nocardia sp. MH4]|uniref:hypothetical protein n=1 Tax=Nocardia sp. MH4 TaxID=1768677 RepID=UPI001C4FE8F0|nr:hypothetical protein [Nocardia sp. MH4]MBW0270062.1 hypothetical protein [Nocardia sp. MH4]